MADGPSAHIETFLQHLGEEEHDRGAVVPPIYQTSLFVFEDWDAFAETTDASRGGRHKYSRLSNPTLDVVHAKLAALEHTEACHLFTSGMAAISAAIMSVAEAGSHIVCVDTCYGPTHAFLRDYMPRYGVTTTFVEGSCADEVRDAVRPETTLVYLESPGSVLFRLQDLTAVTSHAREKGVTTAIDNSAATPVFQTPADFGVDIVLHSATKYLNGHSDVIAGALCTTEERIAEMMSREIGFIGATLPPFPAWLLLRGLRTLPIRMQAHQAAGRRVAEWLMARPEVERVFHPAYFEGGQRDLYQRQMRGAGGQVTFLPRRQDEPYIRRFVDALALYQRGVSWGGHESLVVAMPKQPMDWPSPQWVVRLYCGLEHPDDLTADLAQAFARAAEA